MDTTRFGEPGNAQETNSVVDPCLNSIHLTADRREAFREARRMLLEGRGTATQQLQASAAPGFAAEPGGTCVSSAGMVAAPAGLMLTDAEKSYPLQMGVNTVGRFHDNHVVVNNPHVSRRHCAIVLHSGLRCEVYDTASKNGTFVNGQRIAGPTPVKPGDEIILHNHRMVLIQADDPRYAHTCHGVD